MLKIVTHVLLEESKHKMYQLAFRCRIAQGSCTVQVQLMHRRPLTEQVAHNFCFAITSGNVQGCSPQWAVRGRDVLATDLCQEPNNFCMALLKKEK